MTYNKPEVLVLGGADAIQSSHVKNPPLQKEIVFPDTRATTPAYEADE